MNLTNIRKDVLHRICSNVWNPPEIIVNDSIESSSQTAWNLIDSIFHSVSISVVDAVAPDWFFQFYNFNNVR